MSMKPFKSPTSPSARRMDCRRKGVRLRAGQRGQSMVEYAVIGALALIILLVVPVPGLEAGQHNLSVIGWMVHVLHQWWINYSYLISLP